MGQMKAVLHREAPGIPTVDLFANAPAFEPKLSAYLLAAYASEFDPGTVFLCVVDPGVGTERGAVALEADGKWFVGPDNGLFAIAARRAGAARWYPIRWRPERLTASFHGRDLFAPVAARLARGDRTALAATALPEVDGAGWPQELAQITYIDHYGNAVTGVRAAMVAPDAVLTIAGRSVSRAATFARAAPGTPFWYENSSGLVEIAVNRGRADTTLGLGPGMRFSILPAIASP